MEFSITIFNKDPEGHVIPVDNLTEGQFRFKDVATNQDVAFNHFVNEGNGNYIFGQWAKTAHVVFYIDNVQQSWFGIQRIADNINLDNLDNAEITNLQNGHLIFYDSGSGKWVNRSIQDGDLSSNIPRLNGINSFTGLQQQFAHPFRLAPLPSSPEYDNSLVWKSWVADNFVSGSGNLDRYLAFNQNRILVDSTLDSNITGIKYKDIKDAMNWIYSNGNPSDSNRWTIYILPHPAGAYATDFNWYDYVSIIGIGRVKLVNTPNTPPSAIFLRSGLMSDRNVRAENLDFENTDSNLLVRKMIVVNCTFRCVQVSYESSLTLESSQLEGCGLYIDGTGSIQSGRMNRVINCFGNLDIAWQAGDVNYNWVFQPGDQYQQ